MKKIQLIHNPTAGHGKHSKESLLQLFCGYSVDLRYISTAEQDWTDVTKQAADIIYVAGGDGTVRKVAEALLKNNLPSERSAPLGIISLGTANNIASTLGMVSNKEAMVNPEGSVRAFDLGHIDGVKGLDFFMESFGVGIFPELIRRAKQQKVSNEDPEKELGDVLRLMRDTVKEYKPQRASIKVDGFKIKGSFLLIEVMNIKAVGPNFELAPSADPGDGFFDLVLVPENRRAELLEYIEKRIKGETPNGGLENFARSLRIQKLSLKWKGSLLHIDDNLILDYKGGKIKLRMLSKAIEFIQ